MDPSYLSSGGWEEEPDSGLSSPVLLDNDSHLSLVRNIQTPQQADNRRRHDDIEDRHVIDIWPLDLGESAAKAQHIPLALMIITQLILVLVADLL